MKTREEIEAGIAALRQRQRDRMPISAKKNLAFMEETLLWVLGMDDPDFDIVTGRAK